MPSAPRATTLEIDITKLPPNPPFTAVVSNLPYDIEERQVWDFFGDLKIDKVDIPREDEDGRFKGIAYIIVDGPKDIAVDTLAHVLAKSDHLLSGRKVRIEIYQRRDSRRGGDRDPGFGRSENSDNWRMDRGGGGGGGRNDRFGDRRDDRGYGDRGGYGRGGFDDRRGGGFDDRRGGYDDRRGGGYDDRRGGYEDRRGGGGFDRDRGFGGGRDRYDDRRGYDDRRDDRDGYGGGGFGGGRRDFSAADDDRSWRRDEPEIPVRRDVREERSERPKLNILPRSKPADENSDSSPAQKSSNPFGAARPIDTSAKEKEIEQKLKETHIKDQPYKPREQRKEPVKKLTKEELAAQKAEELKNKIERGLPDKDEEDEKKEVGTKSRFDLLDEE
jgi:translation initiation factor 4B